MKKNGPKIGRGAHQLLRDQAAALVKAYQPLLDSPDGRYCPNPTDAPEDQTWVTIPQALDAVLSALTNFEKTGSFALEIDFKKVHIREAYRAKRKAGANRETAKDELVAEFHRSQSTIERTIKEDKVKTQENAERSANAPALLREAMEGLKKAKKGK